MKFLFPAIVAISAFPGSDAFGTQTRGPRLHSTSLSTASGAGVSRRSGLLSIATVSAILSQSPQPVAARLESVNRPDLLPSEKGLKVIQTEKFLTSGQAKRIDSMLTSLEKDTGFRVRLLCQNYPNTPGLAIRDYWDLGKEVRPKLVGSLWFASS